MSDFIHNIIGKVSGKEAGACTSFLGIKYASLKDRFSSAETVSYDGSGIEATEYGPQVVSSPMGVDIEMSFIQQSLEKPEFPGISDVNGLTLNITVPAKMKDVGTVKDLPVLVFIHGGGFAIGGNWWPQYNFTRLVELSAASGTPIIGVNINYRVGIPGFFTSPELRAANYMPNNGLRDQREALRWIQKYIAGFGGNSESITVMGESAGGVSTGYLLLSEEPLANRLICMGGCPPLLGQIPLETADENAKMIANLLGVGHVPSSNLAQSLLDLPVEDFWTKVPSSIPTVPVIDGDIILEAFTFKSFSGEPTALPGYEWVDAVLVGDSGLDASIMAFAGLLSRRAGIASAFRTSVSKSLKDYPHALESLLQHYSLSELAAGNMTDDEAMFKILNFINDAAFSMPAAELAMRFPGNSFLYVFNEQNPWHGLFKGHASHILDIAFLFQNYNDALDESQRASAKVFGMDVIKFVNGEQPWAAFNSDQPGAAVYAHGRRDYHKLSALEATQRNPFLFELTRVENGPGMDMLMKVFTDFLMS
ncbi:carboxylesteras-like protein [Ilyonectria destructans]|nr:carboxylesteras-like protein [Ilyonectria destructans]